MINEREREWKTDWRLTNLCTYSGYPRDTVFLGDDRVDVNGDNWLTDEWKPNEIYMPSLEVSSPLVYLSLPTLAHRSRNIADP